MYKKSINKDASGLRKNVNLFSLIKTSVSLFFAAIVICMFVGFLWATRKSRCPQCQSPLHETGYIDEKGREDVMCEHCGWEGRI